MLQTSIFGGSTAWFCIFGEGGGGTVGTIFGDFSSLGSLGNQGHASFDESGPLLWRVLKSDRAVHRQFEKSACFPWVGRFGIENVQIHTHGQQSDPRIEINSSDFCCFIHFLDVNHATPAVNATRTPEMQRERHTLGLPEAKSMQRPPYMQLGRAGEAVYRWARPKSVQVPATETYATRPLKVPGGHTDASNATR